MSNGFSYVIDVDILGNTAVGRLIALLDRLDAGFERIEGEVGRVHQRIDNMARAGTAGFNGMASGLKNWIASLGVAAFMLSSLQATAQDESLNNSISFSSGSATEAARNLEYVRRTVDEIGLSLPASLEGFKTLSGSLMGTGLTAAQTRDIFHGVGVAAGAMGMGAEEQKGAFLALGQMASKGKVQAEELRGQLGERLSGAFYQAATAMGVSTAQFDKMLETGKVFAGDFLPRFATQLEKTFGQQAVNNANSAAANFNRLNNALYDLKVTVGTELMPTVTALIQAYLVPGLRWIGQHIDLIFGLTAAFAGIYGVIKLTTLASAAWGVVQGILALETITLNGVLKALNLTMLMNPVFWVIGGIVALTAGVIYAWNKFEGFRGFLVGMWEVIKEFGRILYDHSIAPLLALGKTLVGVFTFDTSLIREGINDGLAAMQKIVDGPSIGERLGSAFSKGFQDGVAAEPLSVGNLLGLSQPPGTAAPFSGSPNGKTPGGGANISKGVEAVTGGGSKNITINIQTMKAAERIEIRQMPNGNIDFSQVEGEMLKLLVQSVSSQNHTQ